MTPITGKPTVRREARSEVAPDRTIIVTVARTGDTHDESFSARVVDLSPHGVKLATDEFLPMGEVVSIQLSLDELGISLNVSADICWMRPAGDEAWVLGCSLHPNLTDDIIKRLAAGGYLERRDECRQAIAIQGTVRWEMDDSESEVVLRDLSHGGFAMTCSHAGEVGQKLLLNVENADSSQAPIAARAVWRLHSDDGYLVGCSFLLPNGRELVERKAGGAADASGPDLPR